MDEDFKKLFKVKVEFEETAPKTNTKTHFACNELKNLFVDFLAKNRCPSGRILIKEDSKGNTIKKINKCY